MHQNGTTITQYQINEIATQYWYGEPIGIIVLEARYPCIPGNVANASTFDFPVRYESAGGGTIEGLLGRHDESMLDGFIAAAQRLESAGVKAITGACGFMALFQKQVQQAVNVPVLLTSLLQIPFIRQVTGRQVGVITANNESLSRMDLTGIGIQNTDFVSIGMEDAPAFTRGVLEESGTLDSAAIEDEVVSKTSRLLHDHPEGGAILSECSDLPPYSYRLQREFGLPVFDYTTMIRHVASTFLHQPYQGMY